MGITVEMVIMVGIPGSGKTTHAKGELPRHVLVSLDIIRRNRQKMHHLAERYGEEVSPQDPSLSVPKRAEYMLASDALLACRDVVIDDTNVTKERRKVHIRLAKKHGARIRAVFFINYGNAMKRNRKRSGRELVPEDVMRRFLKELRRPSAKEGIDVIDVYG